MKAINLTIILICIASSYSFSQTWSGSGTATGDAYRTGNVGIGVSAPNAPLQFSNDFVNRKLVLWSGALNNNYQYCGFGINGATLRYNIDNPTASHVFYTGDAAGTGETELLRIRGTGYMQFPNIQGRKVAVYAMADNEHEYCGLGFNWGIMRYQVGSLGDNHVFFAGSAANPPTYPNPYSNELLRITGTGILKFPNLIANKKIVLWETNGTNEHEYYGFGINGNILRYQIDNPGSSHVFYTGNTVPGSSELMRIRGTGNVSIGGVDPLDKLHIHNGMLRIAGSNIPANSGTGNLRAGVNGTNYSWIQSNASPLLLNPLSTGANNNYVAIGFTPGGATPVPTGYSLVVKGKVICEEMKVKASANWPDYVFQPDYKLMPLDSVAQYVETNHHLPEVPSAQEIEKEGINTGEMDQILLKKIEELTLYMIDQKKEIDVLKEQNKILMEKLEKLSE